MLGKSGLGWSEIAWALRLLSCWERDGCGCCPTCCWRSERCSCQVLYCVVLPHGKYAPLLLRGSGHQDAPPRTLDDGEECAPRPFRLRDINSKPPELILNSAANTARYLGAVVKEPIRALQLVYEMKQDKQTACAIWRR